MLENDMCFVRSHFDCYRVFTWIEKIMTKLSCRDPGNLVDGLQGVHHHTIHLLLPLVHLHLALLREQFPHTFLGTN